MIRRPPRSTQSRSSAASDVYKRQGKWTVYKEYYFDSRKAGKQKTDKEYAQDLIAFLDGKYPQKILVDPSAASFIQEIRSLKKYRVGFAQNEVLDGIRLTSKALADGNLLIYKGCTKLIEQIQSYTWDEKAQSVGLDKPVKVTTTPLMLCVMVLSRFLIIIITKCL